MSITMEEFCSGTHFLLESIYGIWHLWTVVVIG